MWRALLVACTTPVLAIGAVAQVPAGQAPPPRKETRIAPSHDPVHRYQHPEARDGDTSLHSLTPAMIARLDAYEDSTDWKRVRTLAGAAFTLGEGQDVFTAGEYARYEDGAKRVAELRQLVLGWSPRLDDVDRLLVDLELGDLDGGQELAQGGLEAASWVGETTHARLRLRHDLFIDRSGPFGWFPYNQAFSITVLQGDALEADTLDARITQELGAGFGVVTDGFASWLEDGNRQTDAYAELFRRFHLSDSLRLHGRLSYYRSDFLRTGAPYYTPTNLESYGGGASLHWNEGPWAGYLDIGGFYMPSGLDDTGYQARAALEHAWGRDARLRFEWNYYASPERGIALYRTGGFLVLAELAF